MIYCFEKNSVVVSLVPMDLERVGFALPARVRRMRKTRFALVR